MHSIIVMMTLQERSITRFPERPTKWRCHDVTDRILFMHLCIHTNTIIPNLRTVGTVRRKHSKLCLASTYALGSEWHLYPSSNTYILSWLQPAGLKMQYKVRTTYCTLPGIVKHGGVLYIVHYCTNLRYLLFRRLPTTYFSRKNHRLPNCLRADSLLLKTK